jgi:hypothetical protein
MIINKINDEVFVSIDLNILIKITELIKYINMNFNEKDLKQILIENLLFNCYKSNSIKNSHLNEMEDILRDEPIIFCYNDECLIIDGNHRLLKRKKDGFADCKVIFLDYELISKFSEKFL